MQVIIIPGFLSKINKIEHHNVLLTFFCSFSIFLKLIRVALHSVNKKLSLLGDLVRKFWTMCQYKGRYAHAIFTFILGSRSYSKRENVKIFIFPVWSLVVLCGLLGFCELTEYKWGGSPPKNMTTHPTPRNKIQFYNSCRQNKFFTDRLWSCAVTAYPEPEFLDEIQTKVFKSFPPCSSESPLQLYLVIYISSTKQDLLQFI